MTNYINKNDWTLVGELEWPWPNFKPNEFACKGDGSIYVHTPTLDAIQELRTDLGFPFIITSGYRSPQHNAQVSHTGTTGPHTTGHAVDIGVSGERAFTLLKAAMLSGRFTGIGSFQKGPHEKRFIHLDTLPNGEGCPRPTTWSY